MAMTPALRFAAAAQAEELDAFLMTVVEGRFAPFYKKAGGLFSGQQGRGLSMIAPEAMDEFHQGWRRRVAASVRRARCTCWKRKTCRRHGMWLEPHHAAALKQEPGVWTYLQTAYPSPFDPAVVMAQMKRYGDEVLMHHEMARLGGEVQIFALPLVRWTTRDRMYEIIAEMERWMAARSMTPACWSRSRMAE